MFLWDGAVWNPIVGTGTGGGGGTGSAGGSLRAGGTKSFDGDAIQTIFTITHNLGYVPDVVTVEPASIDALGDYIVTKNSTTLVITYQESPPAGPAGNVKFEWAVGMALTPSSNNAGMSAGGVYGANGDSSNFTFNIQHGLTPIPEIAHVIPNTVDAMGSFNVSITSTHIVVQYALAPPTGTGNNVRLLWSAGYAGTASEGFSPGSTTTLTNKTLNVDTNDLKHSTTNATGDILVNNGTKYNRLARGTANQVLAVNTGGTDIAWSNAPVPAGTVTTTGSQTLTNKKIGDNLGYIKVSTPTDPSLEEGILYFKQIDANNNGWFTKCKKNGAIVEVQLG